MENFLPGFIISLREGLEAFLIILVLLKFLEVTNKSLKKSVYLGAISGVLISFVLGGILISLSSFLGGVSAVAKLWESFASLLAVTLVTTFIFWMIKHGGAIKKHIENKASLSLSAKGIFLLSMFMVAREGAEIAIFSFAGKYEPLSIVTGISLAAVIVTLIYHSIVNIKLQTIFNITLAYLILQVGFLLGYGVHEGLSALKTLGFLDSANLIFNKVFNFSDTIFYHKEGVVGLPLYILFGWYSKPEWIQFILQYSYTVSLFYYWYKQEKA